MSSDVITIDFSGVLDERQLAEIEEEKPTETYGRIIL